MDLAGLREKVAGLGKMAEVAEIGQRYAQAICYYEQALEIFVTLI
jgi:hypothetical protein